MECSMDTQRSVPGSSRGMTKLYERSDALLRNVVRGRSIDTMLVGRVLDVRRRCGQHGQELLDQRTGGRQIKCAREGSLRWSLQGGVAKGRQDAPLGRIGLPGGPIRPRRSEEHTSELQ